MQILNSCHEAINLCLENKKFNVAHLYKYDKTFDMHIHDCYEIYFSIAGGHKFLINSQLYNFCGGDIFFINQNESHHVLSVNTENYERYVINIHPQYLEQFTNLANIDLTECFTKRDKQYGHKISLTEKEQQKLLFLIHRLSSTDGFGAEAVEQAIFLEMMVFFNSLYSAKPIENTKTEKKSNKYYDKTSDVISYINQNLSDDLNIDILSRHFALSSSYLSMIFKKETGTTIQKYVTAQRITLAKSLLSEGHSVTETYLACGFNDYSNFLRTFTKMVGISPKKFSMISLE